LISCFVLHQCTQFATVCCIISVNAQGDGGLGGLGGLGDLGLGNLGLGGLGGLGGGQGESIF